MDQQIHLVASNSCMLAQNASSKCFEIFTSLHCLLLNHKIIFEFILIYFDRFFMSFNVLRRVTHFYPFNTILKPQNAVYSSLVANMCTQYSTTELTLCRHSESPVVNSHRSQESTMWTRPDFKYHHSHFILIYFLFFQFMFLLLSSKYFLLIHNYR